VGNSIKPQMTIKSYLETFNLRAMLQSRLTRQTSVLFSSQLALLVIGIFTGVINTRYLGPDNYGTYSFVLAIISFMNIFSGLGFTVAGARLLALASDEEHERKIVGALIITGLCIAFVFSMTVFVSSFFIDMIFRTNIKRSMILISSISGVLPLQMMIDQICSGTNRINDMAFFNLFPKLWYLGAVLILITFSDLNVLAALFLNLGGILIACLIAFKRFKPVFKRFKEHLRSLWKETKEYGFHVYLGAIADSSTYRLDNLFIASFVNTTSVGFYTLATTLVTPVSKLSNSMAISLFKGFTKADRIDKKVILFNFIWLLFCLGFLVIMGKFIVITLFTEKFLPMVPLIIPLAMASFFQGIYTPINLFLAAHRKGKELRFISFVEGGFNVIGNVIFIYYYGAMGAAIASAIAKGMELALNIHFYKRTLVEAGIIG
jgi:O-antigen/teichoic acid export membrane protein